ncbi:hypothetical protein [Nafulsella turpanensis]|uniref:hypothetical protein n=1 Tax=Nafulsella turpanensis TaxID=1265690 RepID=UPI000346678A|nr:hypothetical protein [Nafulsella turpanensis]
MATQEEKDKKVGLAVTVGLHAILLLLFFFILAWRAPDPPLPEYGIELNFGLADAGSGTEQPVTPASQSEEVEEVIEPVAPKSQPIEEPVVEEIPVEPEVQEIVEAETPAEVVSQPAPSPVTKEEVAKKTVKKPQPVEEPKKEEPKKETTKPALFPSDENNTQTTQANQGDREGAVGDQGNEQGTLDSRALYGEPGGGQGGPQLNISGWTWDERPDRKDQSNENGQVVFNFTIDDQGYVISVTTKTSTVSPKVAQFYKEQLLRTTFSPTNGNASRAATTSGTVTFIIKSR